MSVHAYTERLQGDQGVFLGHDREEGLDDLALIVEDALAERVLGPTDGFMARVELISAVDAKRLVAIAEGVEEVDRGAASDGSARNRSSSWSSSGCHRPGIPCSGVSTAL